MENKCNKTPNNSNNNTTNSKYMDHVYCHTNQTKSSFNIAAAPGSGGGAATSPSADVLALLKENKQLKAMLILHLDLIQEQSDQLMAKEKLLITRNEEIESLRTRNGVLDNQVKELQKQLQQQIKRSGEVSTLPPPPLAKIQCKTNQALPLATLGPVTTNGAKIITTTGTAKSNIIGECNGKLISKIVLQRVSMPSGRGKHNESPQSQTTDSENCEDAEEYGEDEEHDDGEEEEVDGEDDGEEDEEEENESHQEENQEHDENEPDNVDDVGEEEEVEHFQDSIDEKSDTHTVVIDDIYDTGNTTEDSNEVLAVQSKRLRLRQAAKQSLALPRGAKPSVSPASTTTNDGQTAFKAVTSSSTSSTTHLSKQPHTPSRGKQMTIMRWHAPDYNTDESISCDSTADVERRSTSATSSPLKSASNLVKKRTHDNSSQLVHHRQKVRRCTYISTPQLYSTRDWEDEAFSCDYDYEFLKTEAKLLQADNPKLEIPKWTEHELTPSYCIEGTEDLSDEVFLKRHAKLEVDEKRRKKWDVQQIREQRRIERLKRRHCKDEIQPPQDTPSLQTFYPTTESLQTICYINDLPVQAFGEMIPRLVTTGGNGTKGEGRRPFQLPWLDKDHLQHLNDNNKPLTVSTINSSEATTTGTLQIQQMLNSSFIFLKKRRRQQSSSFGTLHHNARQRNQASKLANNINNPLNITTPAPSTTSTTTFFNIVKSTVASSSSSTTTATQGLSCLSNDLNLNDLVL